MTQGSEDEVWEQIIANAQQLSFKWDGDEGENPLFPKDKPVENLNNELYCGCGVKYPVLVQSFSGDYYTCSKNNGNKGCGREIRNYKPEGKS